MSENALKNPCCIEDYEKIACNKLPKYATDYFRSGACGEYTLRLNKRAFERLRIRPRMLRDVSCRSTKTTILGSEVAIPIGVSPTAMQKMAHPQGECANARAVGKTGSVFILSTLSTTSIEDVEEGAPDTIKWFQLYIYKTRGITQSLVSRAEEAGFKALVLTVDASIFGKRYADVHNKFCLPSNLKLANFNNDSFSKMAESDSGSSLTDYVNSLFDDTLCWKDVEWLRSITKLPIVLKGILTAEDAKIATSIGVDAIMVSNHGARQLDTCPAAIEVLPEIVKAVNGQCEIYLDGGIRFGTDVFKALALGAKMVFIGRPAVWGLASDGENGVKAVLDILGNEFSQAMALSGCKTLDDIKKEMVVHESIFANL
ncbi:(S)-2-hydroxy-acid oxidase GLO1 isoform X2 [Cimex lectularius]|nr:(S)-2-hydroxy-acid oxidase GLO1 isoform X2 [Cimex lectularius]XP_014254285.1 (S)-2-hydroxy-acid oxidase GLO1 isoform X2 [Cimex lectularius]